MTLATKQRALIEDLNVIHDPHERLNEVVSRGKAMSLPPEQRTADKLVPGCVSRVWLHGTCNNGRTHFSCAADSPVVKGLADLLCGLYSDAEPAEVAAVEPELWEACGFVKMLSPTRLNGLMKVRARIREMAAEFASQ